MRKHQDPVHDRWHAVAGGTEVTITGEVSGAYPPGCLSTPFMVSVSPHAVPVLCMQFVAASQQSLDPLLALGADNSMLMMACIPCHAPLDVCAHSFC